MRKITWTDIWTYTRKYLLNKYVIVLAFFAVVLTFCGEQSIVNRLRYARTIADKEEELETYQKNIQETNAEIQRLNESIENLEQFAREQYYMHAENEDVFIIKED